MIARMKEPEDSRVVALGATGIEHHLGVVAIKELGQGLSSAVHSSAGMLPVEVNRGGVAKVLHPIRTHGLHDLWEQRCSGIGIHIDSAHVTFSCYLIVRAKRIFAPVGSIRRFVTFIIRFTIPECRDARALW